MRRDAITKAGIRAIGVVGVLTLTVPGCWKSDPIPIEGPAMRLAKVLLHNDVSNADHIHIFAPHEDFDLSNRLGPNEGRTVDVRKDLRATFGEIVFRAGRDSVVFVVQVCNFESLKIDRAIDGTVTWIDDQLRCEIS